MSRAGGLPDSIPRYIVEPMGSQSWEVIKIGFRGGTERIAVYNHKNIADDVAGRLNYYARSEVYGNRRSGTGKKNGEPTGTD